MPTTIIDVRSPGHNFDPDAIVGAAGVAFPDATFRQRERFAARLELLKKLGAAEVVTNSSIRLAARVGPCYAWDLPQQDGHEPVHCFVRREIFSCIAKDGIDPATRRRVLEFAASLGTAEVLE
jgi:hypothetical protein